MTVTDIPRPTDTAPDAPDAPASRTAQYPLGWLRGLAALAVVAFHAYQYNRVAPTWSWPWSGTPHELMLGTDMFVDMFFVLSGLVLWLPVARAAIAGESGRPGRVLLLRRMARLLPLYYAIVLAVWVLTNPTFPGHWQDLVLHLTFTQVYSGRYIFWTDGPAWSLAVEFHFYVLMALAVPVVQALAARSSTRARRVAVTMALPALCAIAGAAYLVWATVLSPQDMESWTVWYSPLSRAADFGIGMGLAVLVAAGVRARGPLRAAFGVVSLATIVALVLTRPLQLQVGAWWHPAYAVAVAVGLAGIVLHDGPWSPVWDWRPLVWLGSLGYGIYLVHEPVMRLLGSHGLLPAARPGAFFLVSAVLVAVPSVLLARVSAGTLEPAGLRLLAMIDRRGRPRDYYEHLAPSDRQPAE